MRKHDLHLDLCGAWTLSSDRLEAPIKAEVPGCVHTDLLSAGCIQDPYYRDHEAELQWIGETEWAYCCEFELPDAFMDMEQVDLCCQGLDTLAHISINGVTVGTADNMFRCWTYPVKEVLRKGLNSIEITFASAVDEATRKQKEHFLWHTGIGHHRISGGNWIRKEQCNFGWDWGPMLVTCGIWRPISLRGRRNDTLESIHVEQHHHEDGVDLVVTASIARLGSIPQATHAAVILRLDGECVGEISLPVCASGFEAGMTVTKPALWWPRGMGAQPLYSLETRLLDGTGELLDCDVQSIGLRKLELVREKDRWGQSFKFRANGVDFFAKGANWIPADTFDCRVRDEDLRDLLESAAAANMNMVRVWGGGVYERDAFYDICDELGLCVWQDFMFACSAYPAHEATFLDSVRIEAEQAVKRLRHHPCIALWCGNNELEQIPGIIGDGKGEMRWPDYCALFDTLLAETVQKLDGQRPYWPSSEHSPIGNRSGNEASSDPRWGDAHLWTVWHGREPFEWYRSTFHRFCSEFGFQSFPHPKTVEAFTLPGDRNLTSYVMELHQRSPIGNSAIMDYMLSWFRLPLGWESTVWLSQILQSLAIRYAVEHWRRNMPRCMGAIYWQLNDCWPAASWSSMDSQHRWKALHYDARRFFSPLHVSTVEDADSRSIDVYVTHEGAGELSLSAKIFAEKPCGERVFESVLEAKVAPRGTTLIGKVDCKEVIERHGVRDLFFMVILENNGEEVSRSLVLFPRPKHMNLQRPSLELEDIKEDATGVEVLVSTDKPALWVRMEAKQEPDARWSDNFFHLHAGERKRVRLLSKASGGRAGRLEIEAFDLTSTYLDGSRRE